jgi:PTS system mannitol-specific IIC component
MTQKASIVGVLASIGAATGVSFAVAALLMKTQTSTEEEGDEAALEKATSQMNDMKAASKSHGTASGHNKGNTELADVKSIVVACDAGMGSSAMGASMLRKKIQTSGLNISVTNLAINSLTESADIVITHKDLTDRARMHAPDAQHISLTNFLDSDMYNQLVTKLLSAQKQSAANDDNLVKVSVVAANDDSFELQQPSVFQIERKNIHLGLQAANKEEAIRFAGNKLVELGYVEPEYVDAMFEREALVSTYLGESIAVPHGTVEAKDRVKKTGIVICQYPSGVQFTEDNDDVAKLVIGIAAKNDEHIQVITTITNALDEPEAIEKLTSTKDIEEILNILGGQQAA